MYKPNFCAECGAQIIRARWHFWTSRRFCTECEPRLRKSRLAPPLIAGATLFCLGIVTGRSGRSAPPPLILEQARTSGTTPAGQAKNADSATSAPKNEAGYGPDGTATERPTDPNEVVSVCGARTKKGTPCSRRVRGTGRCWQHKGMNAVLPPEKLIVPGG